MAKNKKAAQLGLEELLERVKQPVALEELLRRILVELNMIPDELED